jgi:hypothetical protein
VDELSKAGGRGRPVGEVFALAGLAPPSSIAEYRSCRDPAHARRIASWLLSLSLVTSLVASRAAAQAPGAPEAAEPRQSEWSFQVIPYLWLPELQGTVSTRGESAQIDVDFDQVFDLLGNGDLLAGMGHFEARYRRFSLFVDAIGGTARPTSAVVFGPRQSLTGTADVTLNFAYVEFGPAYRVLDVPLAGGGRSIELDLLTGGRFMYFYTSIGIEGSGGRVLSTARATTTWVDPFVGGRWSVPLVGDLALIFRGDIGGFGAGSDLAWNLIGGFQYELPWHPGSARTSLILAYKAFDFDYQTGSGEQKTAIALDQRGPAVGLGFEF